MRSSLTVPSGNRSVTRGLGDLIGSPARARLVIHFVVHPEANLGFRALQRHTRLGHRSLVNELERLVRLGAIAKESNLKLRGPTYRAVMGASIWRVLRDLVREAAGPAAILSDALGTLGGVEFAFVYGSMATGDSRADSDVDLLVIGSSLDTTAISRETLQVAALLGREVNVTRFTAREFRERFRAGSRFARTVAAGLKQWIIGDEVQFAASLA